jgi:hypothetical protein
MLLLATLSWSFVGILVTTASTMLDTSIITFSRFALGIVFLGVFLLFKSGRIQLRCFGIHFEKSLIEKRLGSGSALHVLSQKMLIKDMDTGNMNFSVFLWCSIILNLPSRRAISE